MGGSLAVLSAAVDRRVDAAVDLSGPDKWRGALVHEQASGARVPLLVAMADSDGGTEVTAAQETAKAAGGESRFVGAESGHGYALLEEADGRPTVFSDQVLGWIAGS
jgi:dienelactone hydrolase